jgi:CRP-like cAMP-binding protein
VDDGVRAALNASSLSPLPVPVTQRLLTRARLVPIPAGSVTHREGEAAEHLELVVDGLVRVFVTAPDGRTLTVRYCRRGALIGAVSLYATGFRMRCAERGPAVVRRESEPEPSRWVVHRNARGGQLGYDF